MIGWLYPAEAKGQQSYPETRKAGKGHTMSGGAKFIPEKTVTPMGGPGDFIASQ
jgi:hypothetical protein